MLIQSSRSQRSWLAPDSKPPINLRAGINSFDIINNSARLGHVPHLLNADLAELIMCDGNDDGIILGANGSSRRTGKPKFPVAILRVNPRVPDIDNCIVVLERCNDIDNPCIPEIGTVLLE